MSDLKPLQQKAEDAFDQFFSKYQSEMNCQKGCSRCCLFGLSVFAWEAAIIMDWFYSLDEDQKSDWKRRQKLEQSSLSPFVDSEGKETKPCAFLREDQCSIYDVRPSLCRTQGMALQYREGDQVYRDWCPLNFERPSQGPKKADDLNLDQLNAMLSQAQLIYEKQNPEALGPTRVDLGDLRDYLYHHS